MRRPALALLLGCLLLVAGASALDGHDYYQTIEYAACDQETYQQDIVIHRSTGTAYNETAGGLETWHIFVGDHCQADYDDIRFTNSTGELVYYLWPDHDAESARFCVRLEGADRDGVLAIHYGAPTATTSLPTPLKASYTSAGSHTYTVPDGITSVSVLVVAGGGCGGVCGNGAGGGGGGAGGVIYANYDVSGGSSIPVVVGTGGISATSGGTSGGNSEFGSLVAHGGGRGAGWTPSKLFASLSGGSGGGAGYGNARVASPSIATSPEQGSSGGGGISSGGFPGGGGGGAGSIGGSAPSKYIAGSGGNGIQIWGSWYGGGGGAGIWGGTAGSGGTGGGGDGSNSGRGEDATPNTGGGGGGSAGISSVAAILGGSGGSGIVIVSIGSPWSATPPAALTFSGEMGSGASLPFPGLPLIPRDLTGNGLYTDINGNNRLDYNDLTTFFLNLAWARDHEPTECFDFNQNGRLDYADVIALFQVIKNA